jgi:ubiquinone/menaquinone biosynthesis C-methylase UbiE
MTVKKHYKGGSNPQGFDKIVREVFAPIYPVIAEQIIEKTKITNGKCLDAGCGTGALGRSLARLTNMHITFFDQSDEMLEFAREYAKDEHIYNRSSFWQGDIHNIQIESNSIDLIISRGSSPFWDDWHQAYREILRVLKVGGKAYIGGGFGNAELREKIVQTMRENDPNWRKSFKDRLKPEREVLPMIFNSLRPSEFTIIDDESGFWVYITK